MTPARGLEVRVVVADSGPLITLAACDRLNLLEDFATPVWIPDVVRAECLRFPERLGAATLADWFANARRPFAVMPTPLLAAWDTAVALDAEHPHLRTAVGLGDAAIAWLLRQAELGFGSALPTLVLTEDAPFGDGILRDRFPEVHVLSTRAFLRTLQNFGRIESAEAIIADIAAAGRALSRYMADRPGRPAAGTRTTWADILAGRDPSLL